ncbi:MAG: TonB-dependent receptor [Bacteroidales bacterium]|nr:TonB-dependent receptor [Bacteroidales bacterium]
MKKVFLLSFFIFSALAINAQHLTGIVVDGSNGMTLPGATVMLEPGGEGTSSGSDGRFEFTGLDEGRYELSVSFVGYNAISRTVNIREQGKTRITVELSPAVIRADEIVVTGTKTERKLEDVPVRLELVSPRVFAEVPSVDVSGYLDRMSGIDVYNPGGFISHKTNITMRGMSGTNQARVLVLVDGTPINKADGGSVNWNLIQTDQLEKIEITKGPGSSLYGGNALGGVINMVTKKPGRKFQGYVKGEYGSLNTLGGRFNLSGNTGAGTDKGFYYSINGYYRQSDGYINLALEGDDYTYMPEPDTASTTIKNDMQEYGVDLKAGYSFDENNSLELVLNYYDDKRGSGFRYFTEEGSTMDHDTYSGRMTYKGRAGKVKINSSLYVRQENYLKLHDDDRESKYYAVESDRRDMGFLFHASMPLGRMSTLTAGFDLKNGSVDAVDVYQMVSDKVYNRGKMNSYAFFVQDEFRAFDEKLILIGGLRFDNARYYDGAYYIEDGTSATSILTGLEDRNQDEYKWNALSPRLSAQYKFSENFRMYAVYSHGFRPSVLDDLCRSGFVRGGFKKANPLLDPENLDSYEAGADIHLGGLTLSPSFYFSKGKDFMYYVSTGDSLTFFGRKRPVRKVENIGGVEIKGAEVKLKYDFNRGVGVFANYSYTDSRITEFNPEYSSQNEDITGKYLTYVPFNNFSAGLSWRNKIVNAAAVMNYKGKHYANDMNSIVIDPFSAFDIRIWKTIGQFNFKLDVENILNNIALIDDGYINYGRFVRMELTYLF